MTSIMQKPFLNNPCQTCNNGNYVITNDCGEWNLECDECHAVLFCYQPLPHQQAFHQDPHKYKLYAGGYGSGKTTTAAAEFLSLVLSNPGGLSLVGAATLPQLEQTAQKELMAMIHKKLIKDTNKQKNYITLVNGHRILFRPLDSEGKARSLNLSFWWIEEASEVKFDYYVQLQTRLRNNTTTQHKGILSSNPDVGWLRTEILMKSGTIYNSKEVLPQKEEDIDPNIATHIAPTHLNTYLPPTFYEDTAKGKPDWWIARYLEGSFQFSEGTVYPTFSQHVVNIPTEEFKINVQKKGWKVLAGADWGLRDPTVLLLATIDPSDGTVYVYDEHYEPNKPISHHARIMNKKLEHIPLGSLERMVGDPSGARRNPNDKRSVFDHYAEYGLFWQPGNNRIEPGIQKVFNYFALNKLKILSSCVNTIEEGITYKYKPQELDAKKNADEKPEDIDNHAMDVLRYIINELPDDPEQLVNDIHFNPYRERNEEAHLPHALQSEEDPYEIEEDAWMYY
jgi:phage terminase large subunit